ncbi:MAG: endonuclease/exonuclease/phosphatase family protein [Verrucomicrobiales bacterium]|jgi:endonuclease/exonuclease/phosphatase family metal-dependent hydrolase|nr:endonuclease/exonuclease/phosphatase family protein [Verrucomicrobiales bacterium]
MLARTLKIIGLWLLGSASALALLPPKIVIPPHETGAADHEKNFSIGCWNIEWFPGRNPRRAAPHLPRLQIKGVQEILADQNPTIMFACEIRSLADLKKLQLNYPNLACTDIPRPADDDTGLPNQGLAVLSRHPWREIWALDFHEFPAAFNRPARGILGVQFILPNKEPLTVYAVHLKSNLGNPAANRAKREAAIDYLQWDWRRRKLNPARDHIMLLGDFNTSVHDPIFKQEQTLRRLFKLGFTDAADGLPPGQRITIPADNEGYPDNDFDHILISKSLRSRLTTEPPWVKIIPVRYTVSDHYPLFLNADEWFKP